MTRNIRTTIDPTKIVSVTDDEFAGLDRLGLVYAIVGDDDPGPRPAFTEGQYAELLVPESRGYKAIADAVDLATSTGRLSEDGLNATYGLRRPTDFYRALVEASRSLAVQVLTDSTGATPGRTRWPALVAQSLAAQFPAFAVQVCTWSDATQSYGPPVVVSGNPSARYAELNGSSSLVQAPDAPMTGDIHLSAKLDVTTGANATILSRYWSAPNNAWHLSLNANGSLSFQWSADGTATVAAVNSAVPTWTPGTPRWVRVELDVDNGAGGNDLKFYTSPDNATWTQLGTTSTRAGTTSVHDPGEPFPVQIGAYNGNSSRLTGKVYEVEVRNGINGPSLVDRYPDRWATFASTSAAAATFTGKPILTVMVGAHPGATLGYLSDPTRLPKIARADYGPSVAVLGCSHNDARRYGPDYRAAWSAWVIAVRALLGCEVIITTQNPKSPPAAFIEAHRNRRSDLISLAQRDGVTVADAYGAFVDSPLGLASLNESDGIHPSDATGSPLWAKVIESVLLNRPQQ